MSWNLYGMLTWPLPAYPRTSDGGRFRGVIKDLYDEFRRKMGKVSRGVGHLCRVVHDDKSTNLFDNVVEAAVHNPDQEPSIDPCL